MHTLKALIAVGLILSALYAWFGFGTDYGETSDEVNLPLLLQDLSALAVGMILATSVICLLSRRSISRQHSATFLAKIFTPSHAIVVVVFCWLTLSVTDYFFSRFYSPIRIDPSRLKDIGRGDWAGKSIGVALSGGGYRAALLHAGALYELNNRGVAVSHMSTVSGGSIIGTFYAVGGDPRDFLNAVIAGRFNLSRYVIRMDNVLRMICPEWVASLFQTADGICGITRVDIQARLLRELFLGDSDWDSLQGESVPALLINSTDLANGIAVGFSRTHVLFGSLLTGQPFTLRRDLRIKVPEEMSLSKVVAVSGAFPGAFPTTDVQLELLGPSLSEVADKNVRLRQWLERASHEGKPRTISLQLTDGGVLDNTGLMQFQNAWHLAHNPARRPGLFEEWEHKSGRRLDGDWFVPGVLALNGGKPFRSAERQSGLGVLARVLDVATGPTQRAAIENLTLARRLPLTVIDLSPDLLSLISSESPDPLSGRHSIAADDGLPIEGVGITLGGPLMAATERAWIGGSSILNRPDAIRYLANILPNSESNQRAIAAFRTIEERVAKLPPAKPNEAIEAPGLQPIPEWNRDYVRLLEWIESGRCLREGQGHIAADIICDQWELSVRLALDIEFALAVFHKTDTLKAQFSRAHAEAIFRLGRYLVHTGLPASHSELISRRPSENWAR